MRDRRGLTLVELLIASSLLLLLAGVIGGLASAVQTSSNYSQDHADAAQHARVAIERITRNISAATAKGDYPGFAVVYEQVGTWRLPETLLIWRPSGTPANASGPPLVSELVIYCPHPQQPEQLLEIRAPQDSRPIPLDDTLSQSPWRETIAAIKTDANSQRVVLTNLLHTATVTGANLSMQTRAAVRFHPELRPSAAELAAYRNGTLAWSNLSWPQGLASSRSGMRQSWLRIELQLAPASGTAAIPAVPFFGSAAVYYQLTP
jgi:prepilin-type N-terminal cleavage/methylation domain-containing protein